MSNGAWGLANNCEGSPFSTALALEGLLEDSSAFLEQITKGVDWLLTHQLSDGSWGSSYILRIPHPMVKMPWNQISWNHDGKAINAVIKDRNCLFTTSTVIQPLSRIAIDLH